MGNGMNKILPGLYVGNFRDARNMEALTENKITHILAIHDNAKQLSQDREYLCIRASDIASQDLIQYFPQCIDFIHKARLSGGAVLIHCMAGMSRSVTVTAAYIMTVTSLSWRDALNAIRGARKVANPNFGFQRQLQTFEHDFLEKEKDRFRQNYEQNSFGDDADCRKLLEIHRQWVKTGDDSLYPLPHNAYGQQYKGQPSKSTTASGSDGALPQDSISAIFNGLKNGNIVVKEQQDANGNHNSKKSNRKTFISEIESQDSSDVHGYEHSLSEGSPRSQLDTAASVSGLQNISITNEVSSHKHKEQSDRSQIDSS